MDDKDVILSPSGPISFGSFPSTLPPPTKCHSFISNCGLEETPACFSVLPRVSQSVSIEYSGVVFCAVLMVATRSFSPGHPANFNTDTRGNVKVFVSATPLLYY